MYKDWTILECKSYIKKENHDEPHEHHITELIAKKK